MKQGGSRTRFADGFTRTNPLKRGLGGFTIVETMIVLAVTGMLFLSAATLISGKEAKVQFTTAIQNIQQQIQQTINDVQSGYYPNNNLFSCNASVGASPTFVTPPQPNKTQGANQGCIFLGKAIQFGVYNADPNAPEQYDTYTVAGNQQYQSNEVTSWPLAYPTVVARGTNTNHGIGAGVNPQTAKSLQYGLTTAWVRFTNATSTPQTQSVSVVAFVASLASSAGGNLVSGSQKFDVLPIINTRLSKSPADEVDLINANIATAATTGAMDPSSGVQICFNSGTTKQHGIITIGGASGTTNVTLEVDSGVCPS